MKIIDTSSLTPELLERFGKTETLWIYNGLDCCVTHEVDTVTDEVMDDIARGTYTMSLALQGPVLEMNMRGILVDIEERDKVVGSDGSDGRPASGLLGDAALVQRHFDKLCFSLFSRTVNPNSPKVVAQLFYEWLGLPEERQRNNNGEWTATVNREALEKLSDKYFIAKPFVSHILKVRDILKQAGTLLTSLSEENRFHTNLSIAGTKTGRLASSMGDFSVGSNLQNIDKRIRKIFIADPGMKFANVDLEQADAYNIGAMTWNLFPELSQGRHTFLDACQSGDLHTTVSKMVWPDLGWTHDKVENRFIADQPFYREMSYRDTSKRLGHGSNFNGQPPQMAKETRIEQYLVAQFQELYFGAFPEIPARIKWCNEQIWTKGFITTMFGRRRFFLKRKSDKSTLNEACAYEPQSMTAEEINYAMLAIRAVQREHPELQLLMQVHDSLLLQYPEEMEDTLIPLIKQAFRVVLRLRGGREFYVPCEVATGWNWAYPEYDKKTKAVIGNPNGLMKYKGTDVRHRV